MLILDENPNSFNNLDYWREHFTSKMNPVEIQNLTFVVIGNKVDLDKRQVGEVKFLWFVHTTKYIV